MFILEYYIGARKKTNHVAKLTSLLNLLKLFIFGAITSKRMTLCAKSVNLQFGSLMKSKDPDV